MKSRRRGHRSTSRRKKVPRKQAAKKKPKTPKSYSSPTAGKYHCTDPRNPKTRQFAFFTGPTAKHVFFVGHEQDSRDENQLFGFGLNNSGQLGTGRLSGATKQVVGIDFFNKGEEDFGNVIDIVCGDSHTIFLFEEGLFLVGHNINGQLGNAANLNVHTPFQPTLGLPEECEIINIAAGNFFSLVVLVVDGKQVAYACGKNNYGQCGTGDKIAKNVFQKVVISKDVEYCVGMCDASVFFAKDGSIYIAGYNQDARHPLPSNGQFATPQEVTFFNNMTVTGVSTGAYHTMFSTEDQLFVCGHFQSGTNPTKSPTSIVTFGGPKEVLGCAGGYCSTIVRTEKGIFAIGQNSSSYGFLGTGGQGVLSRFQKIPKSDNVVQIEANYLNCYYINDAGRVWAAGVGSNGELLSKSSQTSCFNLLEECGYELSRHDNICGRSRQMKMDEEILERHDLHIMENEEDRDLTIEFSEGGSVRIFSFILVGTSHFPKIDNGKLKVDGKCNVLSGENLIKAYFGVDTESLFVDSRDLLDLYELCVLLELDVHSQMILRELQKCKEVEIVVNMFCIAYNKYEKKDEEYDDDEVITFVSPLCTALFNTMKGRFHEIKKVRKLRKKLERMFLWGDLSEYRKQEVKFEKRVRTFYQAFNWHVSDILSSSRDTSSNLIIVTSDEKEIKVHKQIVCLKSEYFHSVMKFQGTETRKKGYLILDRVPFDQLIIIIDFIYNGDINLTKKQFPQAFATLVEVFPYLQETNLKKCLTKELKKVSLDMIKNATFTLTFGKVAHLLDNMEESLKESFFATWRKKIPEGQLNFLYEKSLAEREKTEEKNKLLAELNELKGKIGQLEKSLKTQELITKSVLSRLDELEKSRKLE